MPPVAITDAPAPASSLQPAPVMAACRTWPVTDDLSQQVYVCVAGAFEEWGTTERQADFLAELTTDLIKDALKTGPSPYITVTVVCEGIRATISVVQAHAPLPPAVRLLPFREAPVESSWGQAQLAAGRFLYASVNLLVHQRRTQ